MYKPEQNYRFYWRKTTGGGAEILRVFASSPKFDIPSEIAGYPVTELGTYCFAPDCPLPEEYMEITNPQGVCADNSITKLCGNYLSSIKLPDSLQKIGDYAFFNCRCLHSLEFAPGLQIIGSDAFMNCQKL
ncbi:MAG: leucine-rich repeat domain-containing protein, partial [Eubacterium sp.]|nr:leucine-rich repeat domain-containing protein [Eubacterium sp.]